MLHHRMRDKSFARERSDGQKRDSRAIGFAIGRAIRGWRDVIEDPPLSS